MAFNTPLPLEAGRDNFNQKVRFATRAGTRMAFVQVTLINHLNFNWI